LRVANGGAANPSSGGGWAKTPAAVVEETRGMPLSSHGQPALASAPAKPSAAAKTCGGSAGGVVALTADKYAQPAAAQRSSAKTLLGTTLRQSAIAAPVNAVKSVFDRAPKLRSHNSFADPLDANKGNVVMGADCVNTSQATGAPTTGPCKGVADVEAAAGVGGAERSWLSNVFKLLFTHLQMLGLLRGIRMDWPDGLDKVRQACGILLGMFACQVSLGWQVQCHPSSSSQTNQLGSKYS
jgi:hypothetical protein